MQYILETERLRLRAFTLEDAEFIVHLVNTPGWLQFIGDRNIKTTRDAVHYLENGPIKSYRENGFGLSLVERKTDCLPIGMCGIIKRENLMFPDIGFAFLPLFTGKGYAFEIASSTLIYAKEQLNIPKIGAITVPGNSRSIRLLERIGLRYMNTIASTGDKEELLLYCTE